MQQPQTARHPVTVYKAHVMLKKKHPFFLYLLTAITVYVMLNTSISTRTVYVSPNLQPQLNRLDSILGAEGIEIDYSGIEKIISIPLEQPRQGIYYGESRVVAINSYMRLPIILGPQMNIADIVNDYVLVVLAHEIMHAQGVDHINDHRSIMYFSDKYTMSHIMTIGPEEYILQTYRQVDSLKLKYPTPLLD